MQFNESQFFLKTHIMELFARENVLVGKGRMKKLLKAVAVALILALLLVADFFWEDSHKPWESGQLDVGNARIMLPIPLADFQGKTNLKVEESSETIRSVQLDAQGKKGYDLGASLKVYVEDDMVTGIIANNKTLGGWIDPDMDALVTFPCSVSTRSTLAEVERRYSTCLFDFFKRESKKRAKRSDFTHHESGVPHQHLRALFQRPLLRGRHRKPAEG